MGWYSVAVQACQRPLKIRGQGQSFKGCSILRQPIMLDGTVMLQVNVPVVDIISLLTKLQICYGFMVDEICY